MPLAYIGLGSNLGDRTGHLMAALEGIGRIGRIRAGSPMYETAPVGDVEQGPFLNAVVSVDTDLGPRDLLNVLLGIEASRGRRRDVRWGPRTLDLDLLVYEGVTLDESGLTIPHPEIRNRRFVLAPLVQTNPRLSDAEGLYADALDRVSRQEIRRASGPLHPDATRWLVGLEDAMSLTRTGDEWSFTCHPDWANTSGDMFGAFLGAVSLFVMRDVVPAMSPVSFSHRFLHGVPAGSQGRVTVAIDRQSPRSIDAVITSTVGSLLVGRSTVNAVASLPGGVSGPPAPEVTGIESTSHITDLVSALGRPVGLSGVNWGMLENWDVPDLADGTEPGIRLWSPNASIGSNDPYFAAAAMLMPIDAAIWPATMRDLGMLAGGPVVFTPTVELSASFVDLDSRDLFHLAEGRVEHRTDSSVFGTIRIWGDNGTYRASGASYNLIRTHPK